jgi:hypothetical protein
MSETLPPRQLSRREDLGDWISYHRRALVVVGIVVTVCLLTGTAGWLYRPSPTFTATCRWTPQGNLTIDGTLTNRRFLPQTYAVPQTARIAGTGKFGDTIAYFHLGPRETRHWSVTYNAPAGLSQHPIVACGAPAYAAHEPDWMTEGR